MQKRFLNILLLVSALALLPACKIADFFKEKFGCTNCVNSATHTTSLPADKNISSSEVVVSMNGKPVVTAQDFETSFQLLMQSQQGIMQVLPMMPEDQIIQLINQIAENLAAERVALEWVKREGIDKTAEYQNNSRMIHDAIDRDLAARTFQSELVKKIQISDSEAKSFYEKNRDTNPYFKRAPFVTGMPSAKASEVVFGDEKSAQAFVAKAKKGNFNQIAKESKLDVKDLGTVNAQSDIDNAIKAKILSAKASTVEMVKGLDNKFHVIYVASKQEPQAAPFDQVKDRVKEVILSEKFQEVYQEELENLKKTYGVTINKDYVKEVAAKLKPQQPAPTESEKKQEEKPAKPKAA